MFIIDFRNKNVSKYGFSVMNNSNVDVVNFYSRFTKYASNTSIYLKVRSNDDTYVDKIAIPSENVSVDEDALVVKWTMGEVSTQCKEIDLQLQFEKEGNIIDQTGIVSLKLADSIDVDELIPPIYPKVLEHLQDQIDELKHDSYALATMGYANDTLTLVFKNKDEDTLLSLQVEIPTSNKMPVFKINQNTKDTLIRDLPQYGYFLGLHFGLFHKYANTSSTPHKIGLMVIDEFGTLVLEAELSTFNDITIDEYFESASYDRYYLTLENYNEYIYSQQQVDTLLGGKLDKSVSANVLYGTKQTGTFPLPVIVEQTTIPYKDTVENGAIVQRTNQGQVNVPNTPTANEHATSKKYVDDLVAKIKKDSYKTVDTTEYPTLNDFLASTGEEGYLYLYPIDTTDLTKGYYRYIWENNSWLSLGTTEIDLSDYLKNNESLVPSATSTYNVGSSGYRWKNLYLSGTAYVDKIDFSSDLYFSINGTNRYVLSGTYFSPTNDNARDLGSAGSRWKDIYLGGSFKDGTNSYTIAESYNLLFNKFQLNIGTEIDWEYFNAFGKSSDTAFTLRTAKNDCFHEYKGTIRNLNSNSSIVLIFNGVSHILCNDDNCHVVNGTNSTITLPAETLIEFSIINGNMVAVNFEA